MKSINFFSAAVGGFIAGPILTQSLINFCTNKDLKKPLKVQYEDNRNLKHLVLGIAALAFSSYAYKSVAATSGAVGGVFTSYLWRRTSKQSAIAAIFSTIVTAKCLDGSLRSELLSFQGWHWALSREAFKVFYFISVFGMGTALACHFILQPVEEPQQKQWINRGYLAGSLMGMVALRILKGPFSQPPTKILTASIASYYFIGRNLVFKGLGL